MNFGDKADSIVFGGVAKEVSINLGEDTAADTIEIDDLSKIESPFSISNFGNEDTLIGAEASPELRVEMWEALIGLVRPQRHRARPAGILPVLGHMSASRSIRAAANEWDDWQLMATKEHV